MPLPVLAGVGAGAAAGGSPQVRSGEAGATWWVTGVLRGARGEADAPTWVPRRVGGRGARGGARGEGDARTWAPGGGGSGESHGVAATATTYSMRVGLREGEGRRRARGLPPRRGGRCRTGGRRRAAGLRRRGPRARARRAPTVRPGGPGCAPGPRRAGGCRAPRSGGCAGSPGGGGGAGSAAGTRRRRAAWYESGARGRSPSI